MELASFVREVSPGTDTTWKESGAHRLRGGGGELGKLKTLNYGSNYFAQTKN